MTAVTSKENLEYANAVGLRLLLGGDHERATTEMVAKADELLGRKEAWEHWKAIDSLLVAGLAEIKRHRPGQATCTATRR